MTAPNKEAVEAACTALWPKDINKYDMKAALAAALPFLAPQPSRSDEERAREIHTQWMRDYGVTDEQIYDLGLPEAGCPTLIDRYASLLASVRADATLAEDAAKDAQIAALQRALRSVRKNIPEGASTAFAIINAALEMSGGVL